MGVDRYSKLLVLCYVPRPEHLASVDEQSRLSAITVQVNSRPCTDLVDLLLFVLCKFTQVSTGFSPFEFLFAHQVRGPLEGDLGGNGSGQGQKYNLLRP